MSLAVQVQVVFYPELLDTPEQQQSILDKLQDFSPVLETEVGPMLEDEQAENFATQNWGGWRPLAESTLREKQRLGYGSQPSLVRTGQLQAAFIPGMPGHKFLVSPGQVIVGVYGEIVPYANYLANGAPSKNLPPRVLIVVRPDTLEKIIQAIADWLGGGDAVKVFADAPVER